MYEFTYKHQITISHYMSVDYDTDGSENHGHVLTVGFKFASMRLNAYNMVFDEDMLKKIVSKLDGKNFNAFMRKNTMSGNATIENMITYLKTQVLLALDKFNTQYNTDVMLRNIAVKDERGCEYVYHYSK